MSFHRAKPAQVEFHHAGEPDVSADEETPVDMGLPSPGAPELAHHGEGTESVRMLYQIG